MQPPLFVDSMVPETHPEPRQTQYSAHYTGPNLFEPHQTQQTPRQDLYPHNYSDVKNLIVDHQTN